MPAFPTEVEWTESANYVRVVAEELNCKLNFDGKYKLILAMNQKGKDRVLYCLCKVNTACPCGDAKTDIETKGKCHCGIFEAK